MTFNVVLILGLREGRWAHRDVDQVLHVVHGDRGAGPGQGQQGPSNGQR